LNITNKLLKRQLKKSKLINCQILEDERVDNFLNLVEDWYENSDKNTYRLERSLNLAIEELEEVNNNLKRIVEEEVKKNIQKEQLMFEQAKLVEMGEMIANIAHQWRQPLSIISTAATGIILHRELGDINIEQENKTLNSINEAAQYLSKTIDDFRDFIKGNSKKENFDIDKLLDKTITIIDATIKNNNIKLIINNKENCNIYGSLNMLIQVMVNIINNAKDILIEKDLVEKLIFINISKTDSQIIISILDNAGGVPKDIIHKIFDAYFTTKHKSQGTGLGLNMAYNIIKNSFNGNIEVKNKEYQYNNINYKGANFIIYLPYEESMK